MKLIPTGDRTKQIAESHPEQSVEEFIDGDTVELTLLCPTHSCAFREGYDNVIWPLFQDLLQTLWRRTSRSGITCAEGWPEHSREGGTFERAGKHDRLGRGEEWFEDPVVCFGGSKMMHGHQTVTRVNATHPTIFYPGKICDVYKMCVYDELGGCSTSALA